MSRERYRVRLVEPQDNPALEQLVKNVLSEFGCVGTGFAWADPELTRMYETYQAPDSAYWVVEEIATSHVVGGGGFSRLKGTDESESVCELQKLYFDPCLRGLGFGRELLERSIHEAARMGYREMYLETVDHMRSAVGLYEKFGFQPLPTARGNTGHNNCTVFMSRPLPVALPCSG